MCNGIYFLWHIYLQGAGENPSEKPAFQGDDGGSGQITLLNEQGEVGISAISSGSGNGAGDRDINQSSFREVCWMIGPFKEEITGKQVIGRLAAMDISLSLTSLEVAGAPDYWVHLEPQVSRKAAIKLLRELQTKNIDSFLITKGELENGISLGFFTRSSLAQQVYEERLKQGYTAKIKEVPRTLTQIWAVFNTGEYGKFSDELWEKIKGVNKGLERRKNYCDTIASIGDLD